MNTRRDNETVLTCNYFRDPSLGLSNAFHSGHFDTSTECLPAPLHHFRSCCSKLAHAAVTAVSVRDRDLRDIAARPRVDSNPAWSRDCALAA